MLNVNQSIKITSIKPSGTVSLLGGATPGIHFPHSRYYIRRVRVKNDNSLINKLKENGYHVEPDVYQPDSTMIVSFPIDVGNNVKTLSKVSMWEQLSLSAFFQKYWADNQVSCTISFNKKTEGDQISGALDYFQYQLKGVSFLPILDDSTPYPQMPYEEIDELKYNELINKIKSKNLNKINMKEDQMDSESNRFCDGDKCIT